MFLRYTYDPFGNVTSINAPITVDIDDLNRYTYNGEDYDYNTGLQYLRARYYNTSMGGFISRDTYLGQILSPLSRNRYIYALNSPVMFDDPSGHETIVVSGGHYEKGKETNSDKNSESSYQYQFVEAGLQQAVSSSQNGENVTWIIADTGFSEPEKRAIKYAATEFGEGKIDVVYISSTTELINYINTKEKPDTTSDTTSDTTEEKEILITETSEDRQSDPITAFYVYSHGLMENKINYGNTWASLSLGYHTPYNDNLRLRSDQLIDLNAAFSEDAYSYLYACRTGVPLDANLDTSSFAQLWANSTGSYTMGATSRTAYHLNRGNIPNGSLYYNSFMATLLAFNNIYMLTSGEYNREMEYYNSIRELAEDAEKYRANRQCYEIMYKATHPTLDGHDPIVIYPAFHAPIIDPSYLEVYGQFELYIPE